MLIDTKRERNIETCPCCHQPMPPTEDDNRCAWCLKPLPLVRYAVGESELTYGEDGLEQVRRFTAYTCSAVCADQFRSDFHYKVD